MSKISTIKRICSNCLHYGEISSVTDIFPNDKKKCTRFKNAVFRQPELSPEKDYTYHTIFTARYNKKLCGSEGKYFTPKYL